MPRKKIDEKKLIKIVNGRQPLSIKLKSGYVNLDANGSTLISPDQLTDDILAKVKSRWVKLEEVFIPIEVDD